jgi:hypothetical protein
MKHVMMCAVTTLAIASGTLAAIGRSGGTTDLTVRGRANSNPSIAADGTFVVVTWAAAATAAGVTDVYSATSRDAGHTFSDPVRVNDMAGDAKVSGEQSPRVALVRRKGAEPSVLVVWTAKGATGTRLVSARSADGGRTFAHSTPVPGAEAGGNRGWQSTASDRDGHVLGIWLDHRELAAGGSSPAMHHDGQAYTGHGDADGVERAQRSKLYFAQLDGVDGAQAVSGGVCYCCKTALATGADGSIYAAWRHVCPGNIRDIAFTLSRDGGRTFAPPVRVSEDKWVLDGCPENGPAIAVDDRNTVHVVWPTLLKASSPASEPKLALFYAATRDGRSFSTRQEIHTEGVPRHPQIALNQRRSLLVTWDEQANGTRRVVAAQGMLAGEEVVSLKRQSIGDTVRGEYPAVTAVDDGFTVAWTSGPPAQSAIRIERIITR